MLILEPLRRKPIALVWGGLALSAIGDQLYAIALVWVAVRLLGPDAGYLSAMQAAAVLLAALLGGLWADAWDHRRTMIGADLLRAAAVLGLVLLGTVAPPLTVGVLVPTALLVAALNAFFRPALHASLPRLAGDPRILPATNALLDSTERIARLLGPILTGALSGILPIIHFFTLDAATFLASAWVVAQLGAVLPRRAAPPAARRTLAGITGALGRGGVALRAQPMIAYAVWSGGAINGFWYVTMFLALPLVIDQRGLAFLGGTSLGAYSAVMASYGLTNLAANLVIGGRPSRRPPRLIFAGNVVLGMGLGAMGAAAALLPAASLLPALMAGAGLAAIGGPMQDIPLATLRQTLFAAGDIAAVTRLYMVTSQAGSLVGMLAAPRLLAALGVPAVVLLCGAAIVAIGAAGLARFGGMGAPPAPAAGAPEHRL